MKNKIAAIVLAVVMVSGGAFTGAFAENSEATDFSGHWAEDTIMSRIGDGLITIPETGEFRPDEAITRIEFVNMINGSFKFWKEWDFSFSDIDEESQYAVDVGKAIWMGYAKGYGDGTFRPNAEITRAEAAKMIDNIFDRKGLDEEILSGYSDNWDIPEWSKEALAFSVSKGYLSGYPDGTIRPNSPMTRAEALVLMDRACGRVFSEPGVYGPETGMETVDGNATIASEGVELRNMEIEGDLHVTAGLGEGDALFSGVIVEGEKYIRGGGIETLGYFAEETTALNDEDILVPGSLGFDIEGIDFSVENGHVFVRDGVETENGLISGKALEDIKEQWKTLPEGYSDESAYVSFDIQAPRNGNLIKAVTYDYGRAVVYETNLLDYAGNESNRGYISIFIFVVNTDADGNPVISPNSAFEYEIEFAWYYEDGSTERTKFDFASIIE